MQNPYRTATRIRIVMYRDDHGPLLELQNPYRTATLPRPRRRRSAGDRGPAARGRHPPVGPRI